MNRRKPTKIYDEKSERKIDENRRTFMKGRGELGNENLKGRGELGKENLKGRGELGNENMKGRGELEMKT